MFLAYHLDQMFWGFLDWLFPPACGGCDRLGFRWCPTCQYQVKHIPEPVCQACGRPISYPGLCVNCKETHPSYEAMRSWAVFEGPIRQALHSLKYRRNVALGDVFARYMAEYLVKLNWQVDLVVPIPLGSRRIRERGYNQSGLLAKPLSFLLGLLYSPQAATRMRETKTQVGLSFEERKENVSNAFQADQKRVSGRTILLVDDVATTGATMAACADSFLDAGARAVYAVTLARALPHHGLQIV